MSFMKSELFGKWTWECRKMPKPYDDENFKRSTSHTSMYCGTSGKYRRSTLHPILTKAIFCYLEQYSENCALGYSTGNKNIIAEYRTKSGDTHLCAYNKSTGKFYAGIYRDDNKKITGYELAEDKNVGTVLFLALIPAALSEKEFADNLRKFEELHLSGKTMYAVGCLHILNDNIYRRINNSKVNDYEIKAVIDKDEKIECFDELFFKNADFKVEKVITGQFNCFQINNSIVKKGNKIKRDDFIGKYVINKKRELSDTEKAMIPELPEWFVIPYEAQIICRHIKDTTGCNINMRNFMLTGPAGTGKTETAKAVASGLGLPYKYFTCSANTEIYDLIGQILPEMTDDIKIYKLPTFEDIKMDASSAYATMTGEYVEDIQEEKVYQKLIEMIENNIKNENNARSYKFIKSPVIEAVENGYVIELQEPSVISNPGVLVGLNGLLDRSGLVTLPNGKMIKRHTDSVIIITTNNDYNGCMEMNQSIISRMNLIVHTQIPDKKTIIERAVKITGFPDKKLLNVMYNVFERLAVRCKETLITDGSVGFREFISWILSTQITGNVYESAILTIIASASNYEENREELINTCLNPVFGNDVSII